MLQMMGKTSEEIDAQVAMLKRYKETLKKTPEAKRKMDEQLWRLWLHRYRERLHGRVVEDESLPAKPTEPEVSQAVCQR